jgi:formate dehydrogenase major subunit
LGTSFGRGGATNFQQDLANSDCIVIMGSNMAECHPVGFQWVMEAKLRGATVIHIDPRFTRTSANASRYVPIRAGSDIAFLGGIINYICENDRLFREYVVAYTNAATIISDDFQDTEDLDGLFSGWDAQRKGYDPASWQYEGMEVHASAGDTEELEPRAGADRFGGHGGLLTRATPPHRDPTLQHPRCVYQLLRKHYSRYTPEFVAETCGVPKELFLSVAKTLVENSGRERTSAFCYAVGWTQHSVGVQYIRTAAIIQLLLGNMGRPGGGIMALRGHASIQGSTDVPTLYDILPGYIPMPHAYHHTSLDGFVERESGLTGGWGRMKAYMVSLLKAWWGERATPDNEFCFRYLPRITGDHSAYQSALKMLDGSLKGYFLFGQNPAVGSANSKLHRFALANLDWLVVRDLVEIESAAFWSAGPEIESGELKTDDIKTEIFWMPAAAHTEKDGSFTNTQRLLQWHHMAVEPRQDARSELWFTYHLGRIIRAKLAGSSAAKDRPVLDLTWEYPLVGDAQDPDAEAVLKEINGVDASGNPLTTFAELKDDGSTACGVWIYCGSYAHGVNQTARRKPGTEQTSVAPEWGWAWPANRRLLYNRASADPGGKPWSERKRYVWWDERQRKWTGNDVPDFTADKPPDYVPPEGATGDAALPGDAPFIMQADGRGWLFTPMGLKDGPLPTHYEPDESPVRNPLYSQQSNPARQILKHRLNPRNENGDGRARYPFVMTTYRLTEHHTAGGMSRFTGVLSELQPEMFCEVSPELARERGLVNGGWATISSSRASIEARVLVTDRMTPVRVQGKIVHQVGLPYHWGFQGLSKGDAANDLYGLVLDPNVHIQDDKAATCDIRPGRRPR